MCLRMFPSTLGQRTSLHMHIEIVKASYLNLLVTSSTKVKYLAVLKYHVKVENAA